MEQLVFGSVGAFGASGQDKRSFGDETDSMPLMPPSSPGPDSLASELELKLQVDGLKHRLKNKKSFQQAVPEFIALMNRSLTFENKKLFYDALNIVSFRVGKPGFDASVAKPLFQVASNKASMFSAGYRKNIADWNQTVDLLLSNPSAQLNRTDGRFNSESVRKKAPTRARVNRSLEPLMQDLFFMRGLLGGHQLSSDSESSDEEGDEELMPFYLPMMAQVASLQPQPQPSTVAVSQEGSYPYSKFCPDQPLFGPSRLKHTTQPTKFTFEFVISMEQMTRAMSPHSSTVVALCCFLNGDLSKSIQSPQSIVYELNGVAVDLPKESDGTTRSHGYDITKLCRPGKNSLSILSKTCCCSYSFGIRMAEHFTLENLIEKAKEQRISKEMGLERVKEAFRDAEDIQLISLKMSLRCPLSQMRISTPAKGRECKHIQCFDLHSYLSMNKSRPKFKCPVCNKPALFESLVVDGFVEGVLEDAPQGVDEIEITPDGKWCVPETKQKRKAETSPFEPVQKKQELDHLSMTPRGPKIEVVDLT